MEKFPSQFLCPTSKLMSTRKLNMTNERVFDLHSNFF